MAFIKTIKAITVKGTGGNDWIFGTSSNTTINGNGGNDTVYGGARNNIINGGHGNDKFMGGAGNDTLNGNGGINTAYYKGSALNYSFSSINSTSFKITDSIASRDGTDLLNGIQYLQFDTTLATTSRAKLGSVTKVATFSFHSPTSSLYHIIQGTNANSTLTGDKPGALTNKNLLLGFNGNDTIDGKAGNDIAFGNGGNDTFLHNVTLNIGAHDYYDGGAGTDTLNLSVTYQQYVNLLHTGALSAFSTWNKAIVFNFQNYVSYMGLKVVNIENLLTPNYAPKAVNDTQIAFTNQNTIKAISGAALVANDTDPVGGNTLSVASLGAGSDSHFTLVGGNVVFTPGTDFQYLPLGQSTTISFIYFVKDQNGITSSTPATVSFTVNGLNDIAAISGTAAGAVTEDGVITAGNILTVTDPDMGENHFQTPSSLSGTYGTFSLNSTSGVWGYTLNNSAANVQALNQGEVVHDTLLVKSFDGTTSQTIDLTINGTNDAPMAIALTNAEANENAPIGTVVGILSATDPDSNSVATYSLVNGYGDNAAFSISENQLLTNTSLNFEAKSSYDVKVHVSDGSSTGFEQIYTITVNDVHEAPTAVDDPNIVTTDQNTGIAILGLDLVANDTDPDAGHTLSVASLVDISDSHFSLIDGNVVFTPDTDFQYLARGESITLSFNYFAQDEHGFLSASPATAFITITGVNEAPTAVDDPNIVTTDQNTGITILGADLVANNTDPDQGDTLSVTSVSGDSHFSLVGGDVDFTPGTDFQYLGEGDSTTLSFNYFAQEEHGLLSASLAIASITITGVNDTPVVGEALANQSAIEKQNLVDFTIPAGSFTDVDTGDPLVLSAIMADDTSLPSWLQFDGTTFSGTPQVVAGTDPQDLSIKVTATDSLGLQASQTFTLEIQQDPFLFDHNLTDGSIHALSGLSSTPITILNMPDTNLSTLANVLSFSINQDGHYTFSLNEGDSNFGNAQFTDFTPVAGTSVTFNIDTSNDGIDATLTATLGTDGNDAIVASGLIYGLGGNDTLEGGADGNNIFFGDVNNIAGGVSPTFGADTFVFDLLNQSANALGNNIIKDFNAGLDQGQPAAADTLSFRNVMDVIHTDGTDGSDGTVDIQDLLALTDVVDNGSGGAKINIYNYAATGDHTAPPGWHSLLNWLY